MATVMYREVLVLESLSGAICHILPLASPQDIGNTAWELAKLLFAHEPFFDAVSQMSATRLKDFPPQNLATTLWGFSMVLFQDKAFLHRTAVVARPRLSEYNSQHLAQMF